MVGHNRLLVAYEDGHSVATMRDFSARLHRLGRGGGYRRFSSQLRHRSLDVAPEFSCRYADLQGKPTDLAISVAVSYSNDMMIELIQQKNDIPSVYMDTVKKRGYGFHHYAVTVNDLAGQSAAFEAQKIEIPFRAVTGPMVDNMPVFYADTTAQIGGMLEVCEYNPTMEKVFASMRHSVRNWDGKNLIIRM